MIIKFLKRKFNSIKICAVFTAVCFMVSTLGANLYAIPMTENANQKYEDVFNKASSISNEYGKITSSKDAQSDITVINIQDLHCHPQTQRNIAKIIGQIADKYNLKKVYVEGGYGDIDVSWLGSIKDENIKKKIIEELVEEGILTGSEYYKLISNNDKVELKGIDERQLHQDNIKRLSLIIENQDKYKELSKKINKEISFLEQKYVNIRNKRFNNNIEDYLSGKIDTRRFYRQLFKYIKDINANPEEYNNVTAIRLEDYPNISKFMTLRKVSKNINVRDVTQQLQIVLNELKSRMPYNTYTRLLKETDNFSDSQKVVELVTLLCEKEGIDLDRKYKALSEFLNSNEINRELNTVELVYEERQLITEIRKALSYNNEEYEITFVSDFSRYFQDYLEYKLTDADWKYFESEYKQFRQLYGKYATVDRIKEIESDIAELNKYYEINDQRNEIFVNNLLQDEEPVILQQSKLRQDEEILKQSKEVIIAVTGGFHSQALEEILQAKEVNTIVITPSIFEGIEKATKQYKGIIKEQSKEFQHQALAYTLASCSDSVVYKRVKDREQVPSDYAVVREEEDGSVVVAEHFQKRILLNAVVRILGTKDVAKIREVLEPIMGKEALTNLEEDINNLEDIGEKFDAKYEPFRNAIDAAVDSIVDSIQTTGNLVLPDQATIDRAMTGLVTSLISVGQIYFSNGVIFEIENSEFYGKDLAGIPAEIYSRMMPTFQRALLLFQLSRTSTVPLNTSSLESDDKIVIVQPRQAADGKTETYDEELSLTVEDLLYIGLNDENEWSFLTSESVRERTENLRERKRQTGLLSKAEKKLKENQVPNYTGAVVDLRIKLKKAQLNKQVVYLSDIFGRQVLIKRKDSNGNDVYCEAVIKYNEETRQWELVPFEEINARYKSIEDGLLSKIEDFTKQFEGKTPEEILKNYPAILQLVILAVVRGFDIDNTFLDNKTLTLGGVKGYFAEYLVKYFTETYLDDQYRLAMPIDSNQEGFDLIDKDGYRIQIKAAARRARATDELDIVGHALEKFKGIPVFATSEIAGEYKEDTDMVFSYGLSHDFIESIAKVAFDILDGLTDGEKSDLRNKAVGKTIETRYLSEFLKDKDLEARAQQERINDDKEEETIRGQRNQQPKAAIKTVDDYVYQCFIELFKSKLNIADEQVTMQPKLGVEEKTQQEEIQQEETATPKRSKLSIFDSRRGEGKIFDFLDATAPLWEEIYRFVPTILSIGLYSFAILPFAPALGWTAIPIAIGISFAIFNMFQRNFIKKHIITDWLKTKDSDIEKINTWKELLSFLYERIKIYTFEIFPSKLEKEQFENFYNNDDDAVAHRNGLVIPTIGISLPYLILIFAMTICSTIPSFQIVMMVTLTASLIHYANNKLIEKGFSLFPKEKEKQKELRYIRGRLQYVRLLLEYPQLKNNLPRITDGPRAEKYGVGTLKKRRAEYLEQFESIRQKLIKGVEKDHPQIKQELLSMDAKKASETIDKIDNLLSIFEEIDSIVNLIEKYKANYEDTREAKEIEKAFFIFVSDVLSKELMSIYDTKVTGDHVRRMVAFANVLGEIAYPNASLKFRYRLMLAALFHDIGKNLIPDSVLNSQNSFDAAEKHIMDFHSVFGDIILRASILQKLSYFAGNHHAAKNAKRGYSYESKLEEISEQPIDFKRDENDKTEDELILEIIALADVYEALSPKLSMDSERLYQLPSRIESIKNILAALDFRGNLSEQKKAVKLLEEIAAIEQEKDETTKQKKEKEFVEKVLYSNNADSLLMYIRNKNEDLIRNRAFKIIFTQDQNTLFDLFEEDKDKFIKDLTANPEIVKIMSLELIDWTKFEFDEETIGAFLEFYFTSMDIDINNQIIDEMGYRKKENAVSLYIKNAILNFRKRQRERQKRLQRILSKYTPVKLSIVDGLREKGAQTDFEKYFKGKKVFLQRFKTEEGVKRVRSFEILKFGKNSINRIIGRFETPVFERDYDSLGIIVEKDSEGNIVSVKAKEGYEFSSLLIDGEPVGDEKNNLNFSLGQISAMLKDVKILDYDAPDIKEDEMDKYVAHIYLDDANVTLENGENALEKAMEEAIKNNKLMVIHVFRKGFSTKGLTLGQIRDKYEQAYSLLQSDKLKNLPVLSETMQLEKDVEIDPYITFDFFLKELLKNHFGHGNFGLFEYPIACYISADGSKMVTYDSSLDLGNSEYRSPFLSEEFKNRGITRGVLDDLMNETLIHGDGKGRKMMAESKTRNFEDSRRVDDSKIAGYRFFKATVTLKLETEEQIEAAKQYKKEQDAKARASMSSVTSAGTENKESELYSFGTSTSKTSSSVSTATEEDWADFWGLQTNTTVARLYNRGLNKYLRKYLEKTGKAVENLTEEELSQIQKDAKNYRFTFPGIFYGVVLETFALFSKGFIAAHGEMSFGMKIVVWTVRALSIGIGLTAAFMSLSVLPVATLLSAVAFPIIFGATTISSGFVIHLLWNIGAVLTNNKGSLLQTTEDTTTQIIQTTQTTQTIVPYAKAELSNGQNIENIIDKVIEVVKGGSTYLFRLQSDKIANFAPSQGTVTVADDKDLSSYGIKNVRVKDSNTLSLELAPGYYIEDQSGSIIDIKIPDSGEHKYIIIRNHSTNEEHIIHLTGSDITEIKICSEKENGQDQTEITMQQLQQDYDCTINNINQTLTLSFPEELPVKLRLSQIKNIIGQEIAITRKVKSNEEDEEKEVIIQVVHFTGRNFLMPRTTTEFTEEELLEYGIEQIEKDSDGNIIGFVFDSKTSMNLDMRQPVGLTEEIMYKRMSQFPESQKTGRGVQLVVLPESQVTITKEYYKKQLEKFLPKHIIKKVLDEIDKETDLSPEKVEDILKRCGITKEYAPMYVEQILAQYIAENISQKENVQIVTRYQFKQVLLRAGVEEVKDDDIVLGEDGYLHLSDSTGIKDKLKQKNPQETKVRGIEDVPTLVNIFTNPGLIPMLLKAFIRIVDSLYKEDRISFQIKEDDKNLTFRDIITHLFEIIDLISLEHFETQLIGYFGEIYCTDTMVAGEIDSIKLRLQLPKDSSEVAIDLIDPVTGMKIQVKTGGTGIVGEHLGKNWLDEDTDIDENLRIGLRQIPVLTVEEVESNYKGDDRKRIKSFGKQSTIKTFLSNVLNIINNLKDVEEKLAKAQRIKLIDIINMAKEDNMEKIYLMLEIFGIDKNVYNSREEILSKFMSLKSKLYSDIDIAEFEKEIFKNIGDLLKGNPKVLNVLIKFLEHKITADDFANEIAGILNPMTEQEKLQQRLNRRLKKSESVVEISKDITIENAENAMLFFKGLNKRFIEVFGEENGYQIYEEYCKFLVLYLYSEMQQIQQNSNSRKSMMQRLVDLLKMKVYRTPLEEKKVAQQELQQLIRENKLDVLDAAILPENMGIVNRMLQQSRSAFVAATVIAFKEFRASLKPNFVDLHQSESGRKGAQQLRDFITRFDVVETDGIATRIIKTILGTIVKGASIVKHITIDYRFIKASGITEAIKMFGSNTYLDENGNVHIPPVMIVDDLQQVQGELIPTGISVNGRSVYQVAESGMLIYGAQGISGVDVSKAINESQMIKDAIENMIRAKGYEGIKVEVEGVIQEEGEGVRFEDGITIIGTQELQGKSVEYVNGFVSSSLEIKRSMGVMYSQKALISLESMDDMEKLEQALKQGRARKIISKSQYEQLQLTPEEIITMRENGIEIYVDSNEIDSNLKENGIVGQIIRKDGQIFIHDYYAQEEVEVEEIGKEDSLLNIENKLVNSQKPILIDIKVLAKQFQKENILGVYKGLNTLIGNIKIKTGIGTINQADIENLAYNIDYNKIPDLGTLSKEKLETLTVDELIEVLNIAENSEIRIILKAIRKNQNLDENGFVNIIKERILAKAVLKENNKEFGLKDKKMEILLGKMLLKQLGNQDKQNVNIPDSFTGEKDNVIKKIMEETDKAMKGDEVAVNTIIEIILVYGDSYKNKQMAKELDANDARNYRAMMAAA